MNFLFVFLLYLKSKTTQTTLEITNLQSQNGRVEIAVFNQENCFLDEKKYFLRLTLGIEPGKKSIQTTLDLPPGEYAISVFHDENNNKKLDKNWVGIPTEPYGFSNNFKAKWGAPTWEKTRFSVGKTTQNLSIRVEKW
jgi:uncharacterized protein (DUF2141 family)